MSETNHKTPLTSLPEEVSQKTSTTKESQPVEKKFTFSTALKPGTTIKNRLCRKTRDFGRIYKSPQSSTSKIEQFVFSSKKSTLDDFHEDKKKHFVDVYETSRVFDEKKQPIQLPMKLVLHDKVSGIDKTRRNNDADSERFLVSYDLDLIRAIEGWSYNLVYRLDKNEVVLGIDSIVLKEKDSRYGEGGKGSSRNQAPLKLEDFTKARSATVSSRLREQKRNNPRNNTDSVPSNEMELMTQLLKSKKDYELVMISVLADGLSYSQPYLSQ